MKDDFTKWQIKIGCTPDEKKDFQPFEGLNAAHSFKENVKEVVEKVMKHLFRKFKASYESSEENMDAVHERAFLSISKVL